MDKTFGTNGVTATLTTANGNSGIVSSSVQLQSDGKILVLVNVTSVTAAGASTATDVATRDILVVNGQAVAQFSSAGSVEATVTGGAVVASAGSQSPSFPSVLQPNGDDLFTDSLFVGEESRAHNASVQVLRLTSTGASDSTFADPSFHFVGAGGSGIEALANGIAVQSNGDIVVVAPQATFAQSGTTTVNGLAKLAQLTSGGSLNTTFGVGGTATNSVPADTERLAGVSIEPADGKIVAIGVANSSTALTVSRYLGQ